MERIRAEASLSPWQRLAADPPETFWRSLKYFGGYRLLVSLVFLGSLHFFGVSLELGYENRAVFRWLCIIYLLLAIVFLLVLRFWQRGFNLQLTVQVLTDIILLTLLMQYSGGYKSGFAFMMLVVLAGAGLVGQGRLSLFFAAMASFAVLFEQTRRALILDADPADFMHSGIVGIGFFATAITARLLAKRVVANETLARQRGQELAEQLSVNEHVIRDMQDGVLVVDAVGQVRQLNPQAAQLLGLAAGQLPKTTALADLSTGLAAGFVRWSQQAKEAVEVLQLPVAGRMRDLRVRFLPAGEAGRTLIYLEDMGRIQEQAQQLKLAALGRLTANMAHEIRNPLAAISHAAELLVDEPRSAIRERLVRIIGDNSQRLNRLVSEVLELGRRDWAQPELLDLQGFMDAFVEEYALHDPRITEALVLEIDDGAKLWFDRMHLNRVLNNLLGNALRHGSTRSGGVRLQVSCVVGPAASRRTEVHVIDDGPGIDTAIQAHVFEPFYTTHSSGTGLGLYIARELCEANDARLELCANPQGVSGAHFCLTGRGE
ncbi:MAG: PAS domain-containing protein [Sterolibacterium sp.]|nr:PAS domain-containing protein [Sterolibacterium sp.]